MEKKVDTRFPTCFPSLHDLTHLRVASVPTRMPRPTYSHVPAYLLGLLISLRLCANGKEEMKLVDKLHLLSKTKDALSVSSPALKKKKKMLTECLHCPYPVFLFFCAETEDGPLRMAAVGRGVEKNVRKAAETSRSA